MATLRIVALRAGARSVITPTPPRAGRTPLSGHHQLQFQHVSPMFPVNSVTDLPGCSQSRRRFGGRLGRRLRTAENVQRYVVFIENRLLNPGDAGGDAGEDPAGPVDVVERDAAPASERHDLRRAHRIGRRCLGRRSRSDCCGGEFEPMSSVVPPGNDEGRQRM